MPRLAALAPGLFTCADVVDDGEQHNFCSLEHAAALLVDSLTEINTAWIQRESLHNRTVARIQIRCHLNSEAGSSISNSFLSNLVLNRSMMPTAERVLFVSRDGALGILGYGGCSYVSSVDIIQELTAGMPSEILFIGGESFNSKDSTKLKGWLIPTVEVRSEAGMSSHDSSLSRNNRLDHIIYLAVNVPLDTNISESVLQEQLVRIVNLLNNLKWDFRCYPDYLCQVPSLIGEITDTGMTQTEYFAAVEESISDMKVGKLSKVVYALRSTATALCPVDPASYLLAVANGNRSDEGKRYTFLFAPHGLEEEAFISLSPEKLCRVDGPRLSTEALAGTYPRQFIDNGGAVHDDKTSREHGTVSDYIAEKLSALGGDVCVDKKELLSMKDVVHYRQVLSTASTIQDMSGINLLTWATKTLHPTPAVCGFPTQTAFENIIAKEKFNRGMYASYCGIVGQSCGELIVGLRSAIVHKSTVHIFAGAGLVLGSVPSAEWEEIKLKMSQYRSVLTSMKRPAMSMDFPNATAAVAAMVVEEMLRQGVGAFCVCPGARSTPFAVAIYRNSAAQAMTQVAHDERAAGFYALGCARAGVLCAVLVTSGTAVSNLLPAVSEARESAIPLILITADRPAESRDVGEAQTIRQVGIFSSAIDFERDFAPPSSDSPKLSALLISSILADISFGVGEIATRRGQRVHFNFQFRKPELDPVVVTKTFSTDFIKLLHPKVNRWVSSLQPFTLHHSTASFFNLSNSVISRIQQWYQSEWRCWSVVVVVGEIRSLQDAIDLRYMSETLRIPCICDTLSMMTSTVSENQCVFLGVDRLLSSPLFSEAFSSTVRMVFRVGGSTISARVQDWMSNMPMAVVVRVRDDAFETSRHDPTWIADQYLHASVSRFSSDLIKIVKRSDLKGQFANRNSKICSALEVLRLANAVHSDDLQQAGSSSFSEPQVAIIVQEETDPSSPIFLSSSMACRDFDAFSALPHQTHSSDTVHAPSFRRVGCNRGANGIDGVISSASGFAYACSSAIAPVTLLIGDVATLHDITGISFAAGVSPGSVGPLSVLGGGMVGKIVCVNNSGGAIFSFLPAAAHRDDFFSPYLDTPHSLDLSAIASALTGSSTSRKCVRVTSASDLRSALRDESVFFIECFGLPNHVDNVALHKKMSERLVNAVNDRLTLAAYSAVQWTMHKNIQRIETKSVLGVEKPLVVLLHGWMGDESDWHQTLLLLGHLNHNNDNNDNNNNNKNNVTSRSSEFDSTPHALCECDVLTVFSGGNTLSPSSFCRALNLILKKDLRVSTQKVLLVGYSQGGRLGMHYRSMYPADVHALITLSTCPGKSPSPLFELSVFRMWQKSKMQSSSDMNASQAFLQSWYGLSVFSDIKRRLPVRADALICKRMSGTSSLDMAMRSMTTACTTVDSYVDLMLVGELDSKYVTLASLNSEKATCGAVRVLPMCGHAILEECPHDAVLAAINLFIAPLPCSILETLTVRLSDISIRPFEIAMKSPLMVLSKGTEKAFHSRRGYRIVLTIATGRRGVDGSEAAYSDGGGDVWAGIGEAYEPVFCVEDKRKYKGGAELTYESMGEEMHDVAARLSDRSFNMTPSPEGVAVVLREVQDLAFSDIVSSPVVFGFQQCMLHALSQAAHVSLVAAMGAVLNKVQRSSHVKINGFASMRKMPSSTPTMNIHEGEKMVTHILKLKVGDEHGTCCLSDAVKVNELVAQSTLKGRWLRLDANQSWSVQQAVEFGNALSPQAVDAIEYVEEPLRFDGTHRDADARIDSYTEMRENCLNWRNLTITLDESLVQLDEDSTERILHSISTDTWHAVVKPSLVSLDCRFLGLEGGKVTVSCTFESGIALSFLVCMSSLFEGTHGVHAKADMAEGDVATGEFTRMSEEGSGHILVSQAEDLINRYAAIHSAALQALLYTE